MMETFNRYDYRNDAEAIQAAEAHIEELEQQRDNYFAIATERALELQQMRDFLERIENASNYYATEPAYSEGTLRYAHQSTRNLAREALAQGVNDEF
jgi:hypothetical protein